MELQPASLLEKFSSSEMQKPNPAPSLPTPSQNGTGMWSLPCKDTIMAYINLKWRRARQIIQPILGSHGYVWASLDSTCVLGQDLHSVGLSYKGKETKAWDQAINSVWEMAKTAAAVSCVPGGLARKFQ